MTRCLLFGLLLAGCIRVEWRRDRVNQPVGEDTVARLAIGTDMTRCLETLGAPTLVWDDARGLALAYRWLDERSFGVSVSYSFSDFVNPSVRYDNAKRRWRGVVLFFDDAYKLRYVRRGLTTAREPANLRRG